LQEDPDDDARSMNSQRSWVRETGLDNIPEEATVPWLLCQSNLLHVFDNWPKESRDKYFYEREILRMQMKKVFSSWSFKQRNTDSWTMEIRSNALMLLGPFPPSFEPLEDTDEEPEEEVSEEPEVVEETRKEKMKRLRKMLRQGKITEMQMLEMIDPRKANRVKARQDRLRVTEARRLHRKAKEKKRLKLRILQEKNAVVSTGDRLVDGEEHIRRISWKTHKLSKYAKIASEQQAHSNNDAERNVFKGIMKDGTKKKDKGSKNSKKRSPFSFLFKKS